MDVAVDESRKEREPGQIETGLVRGGPARGRDVEDTLPHDDRAAAGRLGGGPIDQPRAVEEQPSDAAAPGQPRVSRATTSMCGVWGNMSIGWTAVMR
jgi:hypothetical protein